MLFVLFTDVAGSTIYFKTFGNEAGRRMLREHESIVSECIGSNNGHVIKKIGDSVMASFANPLEVIQASAEIQRSFRSRNLGRSKLQEIHVRIGVHYGEVILEEDDIYGDVVNVSSKLTNLAGADEIYISHDVFMRIKNENQWRFESVDFSRQQDIVHAMAIYKLLWDDSSPEKAGSNKAILTIIPHWSLDTGSFRTSWNHFIVKKASLIGQRTAKEQIFDDGARAISFEEVSQALNAAETVMTFMKDHLGPQPGPQLIPVSIAIDYKLLCSIEKSDVVDRTNLTPGKIQLTQSAREALAAEESKRGSAVDSPEQRSLSNDEQPLEPTDSLFPYRHCVAHGAEQPCLYCGSRKHLPARCPSKQYLQITAELTKLGYRSFDEIGRIFFTYLSGTEASHETDDLASPSLLAERSFYELKESFQLRHLTAVWNQDYLSNVSVPGKNGNLWLAFDCLRVSQTEQAERLLNHFVKGAAAADPAALCLLGLLNAEKRRFNLADYYLNKALSSVKTVREETLLRFLLARIYDLEGSSSEARQMFRAIQRINQNSMEARYNEIILDLKETTDPSHLKKLVSLIEYHREYFIKALIDPDLSPLNMAVEKELQHLYNQAQEQASLQGNMAEQEYARLQKIVTSNNASIGEISALMEKTRELSRTDSYFAFLDRSHLSETIRGLCRRIIVREKKDLLEKLATLENRLDRATHSLAAFGASSSFASLPEAVDDLKKRFRKLRKEIEGEKADFHRSSQEELKALQRKCDAVDTEIVRFESTAKLKASILRFVKDSFFYLFILVAATMFALPIILSLLGSTAEYLWPNLCANTWVYQKGILLYGGTAALLIATYRAYKTILAQ